MDKDVFDATKAAFWLHARDDNAAKLLNFLAYNINVWAAFKGFNDSPVDFPTAIALMHSELSEALEADRKDLRDSHLPQYAGKVVELADLIIRVLHTCGQQNWPIGEVLMAKMAFNCSRPHKHGKAY